MRVCLLCIGVQVPSVRVRARVRVHVCRADMQSDEGTEWLMELLTDVQLQQYFLRIRDELNVTRLTHFDYVKTEDLEKIGMGRPGGHGVGARHITHTSRSRHTHVTRTSHASYSQVLSLQHTQI